jgi:glycosyltransferase involved in cell wall biosynthesis
LADVGDLACSFGRWFANRVAQHLERVELNPLQDVFFGFNTSSLETLATLKTRGIFTVLDQVDPGQVEERIILEEVQRWPGWENAPSAFRPTYWDRIRAEWACADLVMVNSEWSAAGLVEQGLSRDKIIVVPLAIEPNATRVEEPVKPAGKLKVLWLGSLILRKGIQYLVEAAHLLRHSSIEFLVAGPISLSETILRSFPANMKLIGGVTREEVHAIYRRAHVFVLPTLSDGFAVTQLEAMNHGLPVVTTPNCGRVVTDGVDGLVIPPRDSQALAEALARLDRDRPSLSEMSKNALAAASNYHLPSNARCLNEQVKLHRQNRMAQARVY